MTDKKIAVSDEMNKRLIEREKEIKKNHSKLYYPFFKRMADICCSVAALIVMVILLPFVVLAIKIDSRGPVFFSQPRVGQYGQIIKIYKFRTMCVNAESLIDKNVFKNKDNPFLQHENDSRVTKVGAFLRKFSIDELPQLFNVLKGDMSLVGPRPERPFFVEKFKEEIPRYMIKHQVRPGMTGWAQVNGYRGDTSITKRIEHDLYYIENWTLGFDFKIMFLTVFKGFINKNAY